jgi:two-component system, OmpR family, sensor histidine kinase SenX3
MTTLIAAVLAASAGALAGASVAHRRLGRRITSSASRALAGAVEPRAIEPAGALGQLERQVHAQHDAIAAAEGQLATVRASLDELLLGVVVVGRDGSTIMRNSAADSVVGVRHSDALVVRAVNDHVRTALAGETRREVVDLYGPPRRAVVVRSTPLGGAVSAEAAVVTVEDVSERARLEAMRTDFVANISHELRTPVGALALLAETLQGERDAEIIDRLAGKLETEALRVSRTIDDLLELSRIEVDGAHRARVPVDAVVGEAIDRVRVAADHRAITIERQDHGSSLAVPGDRQQLVSALTNLIDNAVKYSEPGSVVTVEHDVDGGNVVIVVADQGIGIPTADLDRVFERFYRVDRARSRTTGGTGLGLAIVRHVVDNHGGSVSVTSREGIGSTFTLRFPAWTSRAMSAQTIEVAS